MQGNLRDFSLAEVLQFIALGRRSGLLEVQVDTERHRISFRNGVIVGVDATTCGIIAMVLEAGLTAPAVLDVALAESQREGRDLGAVLVQRGRVTQAEWQRFIQRELERLLYRLFSLADAPFTFTATPTPTLSPVTFDLPVDRVVLQGTSWAEAWASLRPAVSSWTAKYVATLPEEQLVSLDLPLSEHHLLHLLQRPADVQGLALRAGLTLLEAGRALANLVRAGYARRAA